MTTTFKKKLIEVAIPLEAMNEASAKEKSVRQGHPSAMHLWWARRPVVSCRGILFAQLVDDPSSHPDIFKTKSEIEAERSRLFTLIEKLVTWEAGTDDALLEEARREITRYSNDKKVTVLDPFSGSGTIPAEALRLGLDACGVDLNPVAAVVSKSRVEILPRFSGGAAVNPDGKSLSGHQGLQGIASDFEFYAKRLIEIAREKAGFAYRANPDDKNSKKVIAWVWTRTVPSPDPAFSEVEVPLASSWLLSAKKGQEVIVKPIYDHEAKQVSYSVSKPQSPEALENAKTGTKAGRGANFTCLVSGAAITPKYIKEVGRTRGYGTALIAVVEKARAGRNYRAATDFDLQVASSIQPQWVPDTPISKHPQYMGVAGYGFETFGELFTDRQLFGCTTLYDALDAVENEVLEHARSSGMADEASLHEGGKGALAYSQALRVLLTLALGKLTDLSNAFCPWEPVAQCPRNLFGRQAISMGWTFAEANIFSESSGSLATIVSGIKKALEKNSYDQPLVKGHVWQEDAREIRAGEVPYVICTDPPYYDAVPYADLSDFFYPWMKRSLHRVYPELFTTLSTPKSEELVADRMRYGSTEAADSYFMTGMEEVLSRVSHISDESFPTCVFYAFRASEIEADGISSSGWTAFLEGVLRAGLRIERTWPLRTEMTAGLKAKKNSLATSILVVCRKQAAEAISVTHSEFLRTLKRELPATIKELQSANITPIDMPQAAIGPGIEIFSRFKDVIQADDSRMSVKTALQLINRELDDYLSDIQGEFDADTRFAITWFEQNGLSAGDYGSANSIATARGISVDSVKHAGIVESSAGKVRILKRHELSEDWKPETDPHLTVWECCQHLIKALENKGEYEAAILLKKMGPDKAESVKELAYSLYDICSNKRKDAKEANSYNALIAVWTELTRQAASILETDVGGERQASLGI
ncbi:DUF1156 domain-containing protein [Qipengyuania aurantiaca]|uniref:DUF1156 domain-containing protein n=1 Tax=Qipengyuania aurantiaca TaxID=2867233 RepID=A0ABX8ZKL1_9SPHN|nr:DUF1156 domain-containing protein [Qipengyuania aurantiaca]QZD88669.1 DUF1156 domain-containing protein [Qipengyuania aurantiaca]